MNRSAFLSFVAGLLIWVGACPLAFPQAAELCTNDVTGTIRFNNTNPLLLHLLDAPGNEGMSNVLIYAYSVPPGRYTSSPLRPTTALTMSGYSVKVGVDCEEAGGIPYQILPLAIVGNGQQYYYFNSKTSAPVAASASGAVVDFEECLGVIQFHFVDGFGHPVSVTNGTLWAYRAADNITKATLYSIASGSTQQRLYVEGGKPHWIDLRLFRGSDPRVDRQSHYVRTNLTVGCDQLMDIEIVLPAPGNLGTITGTVDVLREFEWSVEGAPGFTSPEFTTMVAQYGPFENVRWHTLPGDNISLPSSGSFLLRNVVPSTLDPASAGYTLSAQMMFRPHRAAQYLRTPALGAGSNAPVVVAPGASVNLSNIFEINPGYVRGRILLQGPPELPGHPALLRGITHAGDKDEDMDGIPDGSVYGVNWSTIGYEGVDRRAAGARYTASFGYGYGDFDGTYDASSNGYRGHYELALGGLQGEASIWRPSFLSLLMSSGVVTNDDDSFFNLYTIYDRRSAQIEVEPNQPTTNDVAFCFSEVRVHFSSPNAIFYAPQVSWYNGAFSGIDFLGRPADYYINYGIGYGTPTYPHQATNRGQVTLYLPQGTYTLLPGVIPGNSPGGLTGLEPIELTVGCGERIELEPCLQLNLAIPACYRSNQLNLAGSVLTRCSNSVVRAEYELNHGPAVTICTDCGPNPILQLTLGLTGGDNALTVRAYDDRGAVASVSGILRPDAVPPTLRCPVDSLFAEATSPCGAFAVFRVTATDNCDSSPRVVCTPPSGTLFSRGTTPVTCVATDVAGNSAECSFPMFVGGGPEFPLPGLHGVSPQFLGTAGGAQLTVTGTDFTIDDEVLLDGVALQYPVHVSSQEIRGQAPALPPGNHELQLRRCGTIVERLPNACSSGSLPRLFSFEPRQAFARGSNFVTVRGTNFLSTTRIRIGFAAPNGTENLLLNSTVSADGTTIVGLVPPLPGSELLGPRDVIATDSRGSDVLPAGISYLPNPFETDPQVVSLRALQAASTAPISLHWQRGFPGAINARVPVGGATPEERARGFVRTYHDLLRLQMPDAELSVTRVSREGLDDVRLVQSYRGVPVFGAEVVVTLAGNEVWALTGSLLPLSTLEAQAFSINPQLTPAQAIQRAQAQAMLQRPAAELNPRTELMIYSLRVFSDQPLAPRLVWKVTLDYASYEFMVDANSGEIVASLPLETNHDFDLDVQDAKNRFSTGTDGCFGNSDTTAIADEESFNSDYNNDLDAVLAKRYANACWDYFHDVFNWHSYDGANSQLELFLHTTINPSTVASWSKNCQLLQFIDGAVDYDVVVHEFMHGVVFNTSKLLYQFESGALDESYADTMAVIADRERGELESGQPSNWLIGEDLRVPGLAAPVRNFSDPPSIGNQPDVMLNKCCTAVGTPALANDFGGVHRNSGIPNKAGYLMIHGGTFHDIPVVGIGLAKVRQIKFSALRNLPASASFAAARAREITAAQWFADQKLYGIKSADVCTVRNAWTAVGVGQPDYDCDGIEEINDTDEDFIPNNFDNCPFFANPDQADSEIPNPDGVGDKCDNCPSDFNPGQEDYDHDGIGDLCDKDLDGDGCLNAVDQDPYSDLHRIGVSFNPACPDSTSILYGFAGINPAPFVAGSVPYCEDSDDDNDGIPDWGFDGIPGTADDDPCPIGALPHAISGQCAVLGGSCPGTPKNWYEVCFGSGCVEYFAKFEYAINPDPVTTTYVEQIRIVNETLYLQPNTGTSIASLAERIAQVGPRLAFQAQADAAPPNRLRLEIWARATATQPAHLVAVIGEFDPAQLALGQLTFGSMLALTFATNGAPPSVEAAWHIGAEPGTATQDSDQDGLVDGWEILHGLDPYNSADAAFDSDGDGVSNVAEFWAGTNPSDPTSVFRVLRVRRSGDQVRVEFIGAAGRRYQLERSVDLANGGWMPVGAELRSPGGALSLNDPNPNSGNQAFYRVRSLGE